MSLASLGLNYGEERWPHTAIVCGQNRITYKELQDASSNIAKSLYGRGVRRGDCVVVLSSRCLETVVLFHAILEAGACYVPLDLDILSLDRISYVIDAVKPALILSSGASVGGITQPIIPYEELNKEKEHGELRQMEDEATLDDLAYIIFTSGTTSAPKGVMIARRSLLNYVQQSDPPFNMAITPSDRVLSIFSPAFDAFTGVIFSTLYNGGTLVMAGTETLDGCLVECTVLPCTPSILRSIGSPNKYKRLRAIFLGGEAPTEDLVARWSGPRTSVYNCYGPSETTCASLISELRPDSPIDLGLPMKGSKVILVKDDDTNSEEGEIWISGPGLAVGYLNNPELTASKFTIFQGERYYRTGDFARRQDGKLFFLGRGDSMIKNRGFLVNLESEVIPALLSQNGVESAMASHFGNSLYGFVTPESCDSTELRNQMLQTFDAFLVPDRIFALKSLPLNQNGKVDIKALQKIAECNEYSHRMEKTDTLASDPFKSAVVEVLNIPWNTLNESATFISLGGNSLRAIQLLSKLQKQGFQFSMRSLLGDTPLNVVELSVTPLDSTESDIAEESKEVPMTETQINMLSSITTLPLQYYLLVEIEIPTPLSEYDEQRLQRCWEILHQRHPILSCSFDMESQSSWTEPDQKLGWRTIHTTETDLLTTVINEVETFSKEVEETCTMWNPPTAYRLIKAENSSSRLLWFIHHARIDGYSMETLLKEVQILLNGGSLPKATTFASAAAFQHSLRFTSSVETDGVWRRITELQAKAKSINLPRPKPKNSNLRAKNEVEISSGVSVVDIELGCRNAGVTLSSAIYGAWAKLLTWYTGSKTASFGVVFSGRNLPIKDADTVVGPLLNVCPFATGTPQQDQSLNTWLKSIQTQILAMTDSQWMAPTQSSGFDTLVSLQYDIPEPAWNCKSFPGPWKFQQYQKSEFMWTLLVEMEGKELKFRLLYHPSKVTLSATERAVRHFCNILMTMIVAMKDESEQSMKLPLTRSEIAALTQRWQPKAAVPPGHSSLKDAFELTARRYPSLIAVELFLSSMTYRELEIAANTVAWKLMSLPGRPTMVAIMADGGLNWVIATLAVVKAGAVYCPIDVSLPKERINAMIRLSAAQVILCPDSHTQYMALEADIPVISVAEILDTEIQRPENPDTVSSLQDPAYLIFTSGTTGIPKGVLATHQGLLSYISYPPARLHAVPGRRIAQMFSVGFDACAAEIFGTLCYGATLVLKRPENILASLKTVDAAMMTPSLLSACDPKDFPNLKTIVLGGEAVPQALADLWSEGRQLYNGYGPSECTVGSLFRQLAPHSPITLGRPIPGMRVYILNDDHELVPIGVPGDIWLSGAQVTNGYFAAEKKDQVRFQPDPWNKGMTMYMTGDMGRWTETLEVEFLGRRDRQVKLRGYRINLQEVETVIQQSCPSIAQVAVSVKKDRMVGFVSPKNVDVSSIRKSISACLPAYSVPSEIHALDVLPLTANQKLDYRELERICTSLRQRTENAVSLASGLEQDVASIWKDVLDLPHQIISLDDDFFTLGGSSILQLRLIQRLSTWCSSKIPITFVSQYPILREQVDALRKYVPASAPTQTLPQFLEYSKPSDASAEEKVSTMETDMILICQNSLVKTAFNMPCLFKVTGPVDTHRLSSAIYQCWKRFRILRSRYVVEGTRIKRNFHESRFDIIVRFGEAFQNDDFHRLLNEPFDLENDKLLKVVLLYDVAEPDCCYLLFIVHHSIMDATSLKIFLSSISQHYNDERKAIQSEAPGLNYLDYLDWYTSLPPKDDRMAFYQQYLSTPPPPILQPCQTSILDNTAGHMNAQLSSSTYKSIAATSKNWNLSTHELYLSAFFLALSKTFNVHDMIVCIPYAHRHEPGTENLLGNLLDRLPIRLSLDPHIPPTISSLALKAALSMQSALSHALPFSSIIAAQSDTAVSTHSHYYLSEIMFSYHALPNVPSLELAGCAVEYEDGLKSGGAKFPLLCEVWEVGGKGDGEVELDVRVEFMEDWVDGGRVRELVGEFVTVMDGLGDLD